MIIGFHPDSDIITTLSSHYSLLVHLSTFPKIQTTGLLPNLRGVYSTPVLLFVKGGRFLHKLPHRQRKQQYTTFQRKIKGGGWDFLDFFPGRSISLPEVDRRDGRRFLNCGIDQDQKFPNFPLNNPFYRPLFSFFFTFAWDIP